MNKRYLGALLLVPLVIFLFLGGKPLKYLIMILSLLGLHELFNALKKKNIRTISLIAYIFCIIYYILITSKIDFKIITLGLILIVFFLLCIPIIFEKYNFIDVSATILGFVYIPVFFSFLIMTYYKTNGKYLIWLVFISSWLCDTCAYYIGKNFGKRKLCPKVSPNKTLEGSIAGLLGSIVSCTIYGMILINYVNSLNTSIYNFIIIGFFCGIFCQFGDLTASSIKRYAGIKDFSNLIPGHGGILDRFDSILFASVVVYYYITFFMRL